MPCISYSVDSKKGEGSIHPCYDSVGNPLTADTSRPFNIKVHFLLVVVVYHVTIVAFGHGLLKKFWPFW